MYGVSINDVGDVAAQKVGVEGWRYFRWSAADGGHIITGCVPDGVYRSGKRKGKPRLSKPIKGTERTVVVTDAEMQKYAADYEEQTGKCFNCKGTGEVFHSWSVTDGVKKRTCKRCSGTGNATPEQENPNG